MEPVTDGASPISLTNSTRDKRLLIKFRPDSFGHKSTEKVRHGRSALVVIALSHFRSVFRIPSREGERKLSARSGTTYFQASDARAAAFA